MKRSDESAFSAEVVSSAPAFNPENVVVEVSSLSVDAGSSGMLRNISLRIERGTHIALVGPKGSGKSTLLACIAGSKTPQKGTVSTKGSLAGVRQRVRLDAERTVLENVLDGVRARRKWRCKLFGIPKKEKQIAKDILERFGLRSLASSDAKGIEPVEKILVAIARALMRKPDILLIDEPTAGLGFKHSSCVLELLQKEGMRHEITVITVLSNFGLAGKYSDRVVALEKGIIVYDGTSPDPWPEQRLGSAG